MFFTSFQRCLSEEKTKHNPIYCTYIAEQTKPLRAFSVNFVLANLSLDMLVFSSPELLSEVSLKTGNQEHVKVQIKKYPQFITLYLHVYFWMFSKHLIEQRKEFVLNINFILYLIK